MCQTLADDHAWRVLGRDHSGIWTFCQPGTVQPILEAHFRNSIMYSSSPSFSDMILSSVADRNGIGHGEELVFKRLKTAKTPPLLIRRTKSVPTAAMNRHLGVIDGGINFRTNFRMKARKKLGGGEWRAGFV